MAYIDPREVKRVQARKAAVRAQIAAQVEARKAESRRAALARLAPKVAATYAPAEAVKASQRDARGRFTKAGARGARGRFVKVGA